MPTKNPSQVHSRLLEATLDWPKAWATSKADLPLGTAIRDAMMPFLGNAIAQGRSETTLRRYFGSLWLLGGEIVDHYSGHPSKIDKTGREMVMDSIDYSGGPLLGGYYTEEDQRVLDATCKKLLIFLMHQPPTPNGSRQNSETDLSTDSNL